MKTSPMSLFLLPHLGLLRVTGADARAFLQSQLSSDVQQLSARRGQLGGYCSPKGRLLAVLTLVQSGPESFVLVLPKTLVAATLKRLKMFVLRSKVTIDESHDLRPCGSFNDAPTVEAWQVREDKGLLRLRRPGAAIHDLVLVTDARPAANDAAAETHWRLAELGAGIPIVHPETLDRFVPQTADLDLAGGISFSKGCYPGQEIVARVHYLGRLKQRLFLADCAAAAPPGTDVFDADAALAVGEVMDCLPSPAGGYQLSLVLNLSAAASRSLRLAEVQGAPLAALRPAHVLPTA